IGDQCVSTGAIDENVLWLDVSMDDISGVRVVDSAGNVTDDLDGSREWEPPLALEVRSKRLTLDERHREKEQVSCLPCVQDRDNVRMLKVLGQADRAPEPLGVHAGDEIR